MSTRLPRTKRLLVEGIHRNRKRIWEWQMEHARKFPAPFYCSVDLRDSGHKIVPVDSNLFPAGFNNICPEDQRTAPPIVRAHIDAMVSRLGLDEVRRVLVVPESHTTNTWYIENLHYLTQMLTEAGIETRLGWYGPMPEASGPSLELVSATGKKLTARPLSIAGGRMTIEGFDPDLIILNNDFSGGYPRAFDEVRQPIVPSHALGWHSRKKTEHFRHYNRLATEFAGIVGIEPWLITIETEEVAHVNFNEGIGTEEVAQSVERILARTRGEYDSHKVKQEPFVFVKNNSGTYGMGIMVVKSAEELRTMNRRTKNKMSVGKNKAPIESICVQEGIPTATLVDRLAAEPVIYLVGHELIGGFLRASTEKGAEDNLNSQGMVFRKLCMSDLRQTDGEIEGPDAGIDIKQEPVLELVYGSIARLSALATGIELAEHGVHPPT
jgi:glutamate--cysteine ligase